MSITVKADNADDFKAKLNAAITKSLEEMGLAAEGYAKKKCPVDTGRLRNSITHVVADGEKSVYIGTNVEYGPYVELGTSRQRAQPFLRPAATDHTRTYRKILESNLKG